MQIILAILLFILVYAWLLYPVLIAMLRAIVPGRRLQIGGKDVEDVPVAILFSACNEEKVIRRRLENLVDGQKMNARRRITIWVGVDGSTDGTTGVALRFAENHENIHVVDFKERRGKVAVLKDLVRKSRENNNRRLTQINADENSDSLLVFTDANTIFMPDALERLLAPFSDPCVGGVCGRLEFVENKSSSSSSLVAGSQPHSSPSEGFYWSVENMLKTMESRLDSCLGANGAIYAIRSNLFRDEIPDNTIVDDFVIGMKVREQEYRMLYEPDAVAEEEYPVESDEWRRRVRIGTGDFQALVLCWKCLLPKYGVFAWQFWSHKMLRWFTPHIMLLMVICSLLMVVESGLKSANYLALVVLAGAAVFILSSGIGRVVCHSAVNPVGRFFRMCSYFLDMNAALFAGSVRFLAGDLKGYWERTPRE